MPVILETWKAEVGEAYFSEAKLGNSGGLHHFPEYEHKCYDS